MYIPCVKYTDVDSLRNYGLTIAVPCGWFVPDAACVAYTGYVRPRQPCGMHTGLRVLC